MKKLQIHWRILKFNPYYYLPRHIIVLFLLSKSFFTIIPLADTQFYGSWWVKNCFLYLQFDQKKMFFCQRVKIQGFEKLAIVFEKKGLHSWRKKNDIFN